VVRPVVVVAAAGSELPELPADVLRAFDRHPQRGPLEGLAAGLKKLSAFDAKAIDAVYLTSCDVPLLLPCFIHRMIDLLGDAPAAVPRIDGRLHPLAAVYRTSVFAEVERRLATDQLRMTDFVEALHPRLVEADELREVDPQFESLRNVNDRESYAAALAALDARNRKRGPEPPFGE
jgi:molybdopterin-guanine dinucleotide biosynthesis protein A